MSGPADDLLPLFLTEATDRLDRLDTLLDRAPEEADAMREARRELHTLKGASRMMGLVEIADVCHEAEDAVEATTADDLGPVESLVRRIRSMVESIAGGTGEAEPAAAAGAETSQMPLKADAPPLTTISVSAPVLDAISEQAIGLSFLSARVAAMVNDLFEASNQAERGATDDLPHQVLASLAVRLRRLAFDAEQTATRLENRCEHQLSSLVDLQVQPIRPLLAGLKRHALELAHSIDKPVEVSVEAADCQLDRRIMDALREALVHLVRNAVDHGIEGPVDRAASGKPKGGIIQLRAQTLDERVRLTVADDGHGIDPQSILAVALERGTVDPEAAQTMSDEEVRQLLFLPGFSTREVSSSLSGRGVGLDSVAEAVRGVGGQVWIESRPGEGTAFVIDLPIARRGESVVVIEAAGYRVALPAAAVRVFSHAGVGTAEPGESVDETREIDLCQMFGDAFDEGRTIIKAHAGGVDLTVRVDRVVGEADVYLHPWPRCLGSIRGSDAMALLPDGTAVGVLDLNGIVRHRFRRPAVGIPAPATRAQSLKVLLVDDSRITREMLRRILLEGGIEVTAVASGDEALTVLGDHTVDCLVTDIEMPGIDGLELTRRVRAYEGLENLPIVVVSTRNRDADRLAGLEAGADAYLAKQNLVGDELMRLVLQLGGGH